MEIKGLFGDLFDLDHNGVMDEYEQAAEFAAFMMMLEDEESEEDEVDDDSDF